MTARLFRGIRAFRGFNDWNITNKKPRSFAGSGALLKGS
jgi:hypothetical protein